MRVRAAAAVSAAILAVTLRPAWPDGVGLPGSKHDFSSRSWMPNRELCVICHAPHNGASPGGAGLVWNHRQTGAAFTPYQSSTLKAAVGQPDGSSRLCLSCHDGTVALDAFGGRGGADLCGRIIGTDIRGVHPVSFVYDDALAVAAGHLKSPSSTPSGLGGTIAADMLRGGKMQCSSCHEPHNRFGRGKFLRADNGKDRLCGICHLRQPPGSIQMGGW